jgi:hypothetical protein
LLYYYYYQAFALPLIGKPLLEIKKLSASGKYEKDLIDLYIIETKVIILSIITILIIMLYSL